MEDVHDSFFYDGQEIHRAFQNFSIGNLKATCRSYIAIAGADTRSKLYTVIGQAPPSVQEKIREDVGECMRNGKRMYARRTTAVGSRQDPGPNTDQHAIDSDGNDGDEIVNVLCQNAFMKAPQKHVIDGLIGDFIDRTSNSAMAVAACAVCARELNRTDLTSYRLDLIPSRHLLRPAIPHPAHDILDGMLLHPAGVTNAEMANVCIECSRALKSDKIPACALANGMWIGATPHDLAYLTLPERLLIAKYFPAAYIIKLYPKKKGARHWDQRQMYSGLKGNVSTYQLDQGQISSMIDGTIMPQQTKILAATLGITFVGPKNLPEKSFPSIFKVRRTRVRKALEWLKTNNPLFANITISESRLAELPEDDIPYELRVTAKLSTDVDKVHAEHEGYVPSQEAGDGDADDGQ